MTKLQKARNEINERFRQVMPQKFHEKFGIEIETEYSFVAGAVYSARVDGGDFTTEQAAFIDAFEDGYGLALAVLDEMLVQ